MQRKHFLATGLLWAAAIVAAAIAGAPIFYTTFLLPILAASAMVLMPPKVQAPN